MALNHIAIHGRLVRDPELRQTQSGVSVCNFTVAVDDDFARQGEERETDFIDCVAWRGLAEHVSRWFKKGKEIVVSGRLKSRKWQDKDGNNRVSWEIMANSVDFCGSKSDNATNAAAPTYAAPAVDGGFAEIAEEDGELPF